MAPLAEHTALDPTYGIRVGVVESVEPRGTAGRSIRINGIGEETGLEGEFGLQSNLQWGSVLEAPPRQTNASRSTGDLREETEMPVFRLISRSIVKRTSDEEYNQMVQQHRQLAMKRLTGGLTREEELRLQLTKWNIDQIEDARYGESLDALEIIVRAHENAASGFEHAIENFDRLVSSYRKPKRHRRHRRR